MGFAVLRTSCGVCPLTGKLFCYIHGPKPYKFIGFGGIHGPKPYKFIRFGGIHGPKTYKFMGFGGIIRFAYTPIRPKPGQKRQE